jgi:NitT/TauT family transport system substrate-binding protein
MHMGHGSHVEYIVYPDSESRFSFLHARRTVRSSAWEEGSVSFATAFRPRRSGSPARVFTIRAPNGTGLAVSRVREVNRYSSRIRSSSAWEGFRRVGLGLRRATSNSSTLLTIVKATRLEHCVLPCRMGKADRIRTCHLLFALLALLAVGCHRSSETGLPKVILQADWYPQPEHGGFYTALVNGYYKDEGLDVIIQPGGPYVSVEQQVATGAAQFGMGTSDKALESIADGQPLVAVAATMQHDPQGIMVRKDSPIHSFADLNGHTVAIKTGSTWFQYIQKRYNLNVRETPAMMNVANFVADPNYIQQCFATSEPFFARQAGIETRVMLTSDAGYSPYRVMFTTRDYLAQHPDLVAKFVRASLKGWGEYLNDPAAAHAAIAKLNPALNPEWMQFTWQALRDGHFVTGDAASGAKLGQMESGRWSTMYQQLLDLKVIDKQFDPATAYTLQFVGPN